MSDQLNVFGIITDLSDKDRQIVELTNWGSNSNNQIKFVGRQYSLDNMQLL